MDIEHIALNIKDPVKAAEWHTNNLGMKVIRSSGEAPYVHFIADKAGRVLFEFYSNPDAPVPDYASMDPLVLHIAFKSDDVKSQRQRLIDGGATPEGEITNTPAGDEIAMLRDPWGIPIQLVKRAKPIK